MSKLLFQESLLSSDEENDSDTSNNSHDQLSSISKTIQTTSKTLIYDAKNDEVNVSLGKRQRCIHDDTTHSNHSHSNTSEVLQSGKTVSTYLSNFLSQKRAPVILEAPALCPLRDDLLREFHSSAKNVLPVEQHDVESESSDEYDVNGRILNSDEETSDSDSESEDNTTYKLRLFNLPYTISEGKIISAARGHGVSFESVEIVMDRKSNRPSGMAVAVLNLPPSTVASEYLSECTDKLQEKDIGGRPVRVKVEGTGNQRQSLGGQGRRYFGGDISSKCHSCGETGHRQAECPNDEVMPPCHLCAGTDHEPVDCPNIACYRCFTFGHHSRNCQSANKGMRPVVCTLCGSRTHDKRFCRMDSATARNKIEGPLDTTLCMSCGKTGHCMCLTLPPVHDKRLYCPTCGLAGHHADYVNNPETEPSCRNPYLSKTKLDVSREGRGRESSRRDQSNQRPRLQQPSNRRQDQSSRDASGRDMFDDPIDDEYIDNTYEPRREKRGRKIVCTDSDDNNRPRGYNRNRESRNIESKAGNGYRTNEVEHSSRFKRPGSAFSRGGGSQRGKVYRR